ncbi:MAG: MFS transporter [Pseudomonadota bacterium]
MGIQDAVVLTTASRHAIDPSLITGGVSDIQAFVDGQPLRAIHYAILALCCLVLFIDGYNIFVVGKIAPTIAAAYGSASTAMTSVFVLQQIGLAIGAFAAAPLADRFGRKRLLVVCLAMLGMLIALSPLARTLSELAVLRCLAGFFLAGVLPVCIALIAEFSPRMQRARFISIALLGFSAGTASGGIVAAWLVDIWSWKAAFWIGGIVPLALLPLLLSALPESLQYQVNRGSGPEHVLRGIRTIDPTAFIAPGRRLVSGDGSSGIRSASVAAILEQGRLASTLVMWVTTFLSLGSVALLGAWLPTFFHELKGIPVQRFAAFVLWGFAGGLGGTLAAGWLMDRFRSSYTISVFFFGLAGSLLALGFVPFGTPLFAALIIAWYFCQAGGQTLIHTLLSRIYPSKIRGTGMGWAGGTGGVGGIVAPLLGGWALHAQFSLPVFMLMAAAMPLVVAVVHLTMPVQSAKA